MADQLELFWAPAHWRVCGNPECASQWGPMPPGEFADDPESRLCSVCFGARTWVRNPCRDCGKRVLTTLNVAVPVCMACRRTRGDQARKARKRQYDQARHQRRTLSTASPQAGAGNVNDKRSAS